MKKSTILFTGGGSAGHVTPNVSIMNEIQDRWNLYYIGSKKGLEKDILKNENILYYEISTGKLRRYFSFKNFTDVFKIIIGVVESYRIIKKIKPDLIFSKGGFVTVPVVIAAFLQKVPILIHESDLTPGLANKISSKFATKIFTTFEETVGYFPQKKAIYTGPPVRKSILSGNKQQIINKYSLCNNLPVITVMGGSLGSKKINKIIRESLKYLTCKYQIIHICGKDNLDCSLKNQKNYYQFEYISDDLPHLLVASSLVITRGGSNILFELLALKIPMLVIPLSAEQSRGDQLLNASYFEKKGYSVTLDEKELNKENLIESTNYLFENRMKFINEMNKINNVDVVKIISKEIDFYLK